MIEVVDELISKNDFDFIEFIPKLIEILNERSYYSNKSYKEFIEKIMKYKNGE